MRECSIFQFYYSLYKKRGFFRKIEKLEQFPFNEKLLSCKNVGVFPDMAIRINKGHKVFQGGELIELKDSKSYSVSSFNSTIPGRKKKIEDVILSKNSSIKYQMEQAGDDIYSMPERDVYYLLRGKKSDHLKVCLVYGSFFETIKIEDLISQSFNQVMEERMKESDFIMDEETKRKLNSIFSLQRNFSKVRSVDRASIKLRFRIQTEVKSEGNILNGVKYPEIKDDSLNFVLPCHTDEEEQLHRSKLEKVFTSRELEKFAFFKLKHHFNGYFLVMQCQL